MSGLEVGLRRIVFARPRVGVVPAPDRITLSRWFTKTAMLLADAFGADFLEPEHRSKVRTGMPDDVEVVVGRRRRPPQRLDFALDLALDAERNAPRARAVAIQVDDVLGWVAGRGRLTSAHGTRLWPLRSHVLRWDTLPVVTRSLSR